MKKGAAWRRMGRRFSISEGQAGAHGAAAGAERMAFEIGAPDASGTRYRNHRALSRMYYVLWTHVECAVPSVPCAARGGLMRGPVGVEDGATK